MRWRSRYVRSLFRNRIIRLIWRLRLVRRFQTPPCRANELAEHDPDLIAGIHYPSLFARGVAPKLKIDPGGDAVADIAYRVCCLTAEWPSIASAADYSGWIPACLMTSPQRLVSSVISLRRSAGLPPVP